MGESDERRRRTSTRADDDATDVERLPAPPDGISRVDTLPDDFARSISRRPHLIGDVIARRYKLVETLGDGAMGQVFIAENLAIGSRVAIKVLKAELLGDPAFRRRFQHEAMAIAAIEHRNVARFFDLIVGDPTFLVMEYVAGPTLSQVLKRERRLPLARAINITLRLAWALEATHRAGVIHRDVKPGNVILSPDPELGEEPKLIDFGLAKLPTLVGAEELTRTGQIVGTPQYMSPEQIANRNVDARSDVYSLGCLLHHLIAGQPPFFGGDDVQILYRQIEQPPPTLRSLDPSVPQAVDALLQKALAKRPEQRHQTMRELALALGEIDRRGAATTSVVPATRAPRGWLSRRVPWSVAVGAPAALALALLAYFAAVRPASRGAVVFVTSDPQGAAIELDGERVQGTTPRALLGLAPGEHVMRLHLAGHDPIERILHLDRGEQTDVRAVLPPASHPVEVTSVPQGALVFMDGHLIPGQTPLTLAVSDDDFHELRVEKSGFVSMRGRITPDDQRRTITFTMPVESEPVGTLWIDSNRSAHVFIDGSDSGFLTPTVGVREPAGRHTLELRDDAGRVRASQVVELGRGQTLYPMLHWDETGGTR